MYKMEYKEYMKEKKDKGKRKDQVPDKSKRRNEVDHVVKQVLTTWGDSSSESDKSEHPEYAFMLAVEEGDTILNCILFSWKIQIMR